MALPRTTLVKVGGGVRGWAGGAPPACSWPRLCRMPRCASPHGSATRSAAVACGAVCGAPQGRNLRAVTCAGHQQVRASVSVPPHEPLYDPRMPSATLSSGSRCRKHGVLSGFLDNRRMLYLAARTTPAGYPHAQMLHLMSSTRPRPSASGSKMGVSWGTPVLATSPGSRVSTKTTWS